MSESVSQKWLDRSFEPPLDPGIERAVHILLDAGLEPFESCEGGSGHCYPEPTVRLHGGRAVGFRAIAALQENGLPVRSIRRAWPVVDGELTGPHWEVAFSRKLTCLPR